MKKHISLVVTLALLLLVQPIVTAQTPAAQNEQPMIFKAGISNEEKLKVFDECWRTVNEKYFDPKFNGVDWIGMREKYRSQALAARDKFGLLNVLAQMLNELKTSHVFVHLNFKLKRNQVEEKFGGKFDRKKTNIALNYGFGLQHIEGHWVITQVDEGSSAQEMGIQKGWILTHINDKNDEFILESSEGATARLRLLDLEGKEREVTLVCKSYLKPQTQIREVKALSSGVIYVRFAHFDKYTDDWLENQVKLNINVPAMIIDLRDNSGGLINTLKNSLDLFFAEKVKIGERIERDADEKDFRVGGKGKAAYRGKVIVLIDERSASGAEIFAAAIQDTGRGRILGRKSAGSVLTAVSKDLSAGFTLNVAINDYRTIKGVRLEGRGITPDEVLPFTISDFRLNRDHDLERALELLK